MLIGGPSCWGFMSGRGTAWPSSEGQAASLLIQRPAWKTPCLGEPGGLQSTGLQSVGHDRARRVVLGPQKNWAESPLPNQSAPRPVIDIFLPCDKLAVWSGWWASIDILPLTKVHSFTLGFILCVHSCMSFDKYKMVSLHHYCIIQNSFTALKNLLCSNYSSLSTSPGPQVTDVLWHLHSSAFSWMPFQTGFSHFTMFTNICLSFPSYVWVSSHSLITHFLNHLMMFHCLSSKFSIPWFQALVL